MGIVNIEPREGDVIRAVNQAGEGETVRLESSTVFPVQERTDEVLSAIGGTETLNANSRQVDNPDNVIDRQVVVTGELTDAQREYLRTTGVGYSDVEEPETNSSGSTSSSTSSGLQGTDDSSSSSSSSGGSGSSGSSGSGGSTGGESSPSGGLAQSIVLPSGSQGEGGVDTLVLLGIALLFAGLLFAATGGF